MDSYLHDQGQDGAGAAQSILQSLADEATDSMEFFSGSKTLKKKIDEVLGSLAATSDRMSEVSDKLSEEKKRQLETAVKIKDALLQLYGVRKTMRDALYVYSSGSKEEETDAERFATLFSSLMQALAPLRGIMSTVGIGDIPLLDSVISTLNGLSMLSQYISAMPQDVVDNALANAKAAKEQLNRIRTSFADDKEDSGLWTTWNKVLYDDESSSLRGIIMELGECFKAAVEMVETSTQCILIQLLLMLLEKIKPILQYFAIGISEIVDLLLSLKTLVVMLVRSKWTMVDMLKKTIWAYFNDIWDALIFICVDTKNIIPTDLSSIACWKSAISDKCELSSLNLYLDFNEIGIKSKTDLKTSKDYMKAMVEAYSEMSELKSKPTIDNEAVATCKRRLISLASALKDTGLDVKDDFLKGKDAYLKYLSLNGNIKHVYDAELDSQTSVDEFLNPAKK